MQPATAYSIRGTDYYRVTIPAYELLSTLAELGFNLYALTTVPAGSDHVQLTVVASPTAKGHSATSSMCWRISSRR